MSKMGVACVVTSIALYLASSTVWWRHSWNLYVLRGACLYVHPFQGLKWSSCRFIHMRLEVEGPQKWTPSIPVWPSQDKPELGGTIKAWTCQVWKHKQVVFCIHDSRCRGVSWHLFRVIKLFMTVKVAAYKMSVQIADLSLYQTRATTFGVLEMLCKLSLFTFNVKTYHFKSFASKRKTTSQHVFCMEHEAILCFFAFPQLYQNNERL